VVESPSLEVFKKCVDIPLQELDDVVAKPLTMTFTKSWQSSEVPRDCKK